MCKGKEILVFLPLGYQDGRDRHAGISSRITELRLDWCIHLLREAAQLSSALCAENLGRFDGAIVLDHTCSEGFNSPEACTQMRRRLAAFATQSHLPLVLLETSDPSVFKGTRTVFVNIDNRRIAELATQTLVDCGPHASYAYVGVGGPPLWSEQRRQAFAVALGECGVIDRRQDVVCSLDDDGDDEALKTFLLNLPKPAAVFAACDRLAAKVMDGCHAAGIRVPDDVSVLGVDNETITCTYARPSLSSVWPDFEAEGRLSVDSLAHLLKGGRVSAKPIYCGVKGVALRDSTKPASPAGRLVSNADEYIRMNLGHRFSVGDIAAHLKVSRRLLDMRYRQIKHISIAESIRDKRLDEVARLLRASTLSMSEISFKCGFLSESHLKTRFKERFGVSMGVWRSERPAPVSARPQR